ncbi:O-antigen/teichoic acid export membrane protein [Chryseobacterium sp. SLBN-27]|uniref:lipopolysaccharide biosynthesis protein n=1 Tax=Chryseobacterium sp. SLBN-27 TaxID=3042287 RepID=UPI002857D541|nr:oligosaccharide flippase family protein [Chryseobacterium sp. SLBN-27]MDR6158521.1 O-antigen/teichoic acid export membrane protein [Chryseobacterium sp. SLBN-27]
MNFRDIINTVKTNAFLQNVAILSSGTIISQLIVIATSPLLSRLYSVESFGTLSIFTSFTVFLAVLSTGRYELALGLPSGNNKASAMFKLIIYIGVSVSFIYLLLIVLLKDILKINDKTNFLSGIYAYIAPLYIFFGAIYSALGYWNQRNKNYKKITFANAIQVISSCILSLLFGLLNYNGGLIWGLIFGIVISTGYLFFTDKKLIKYLKLQSYSVKKVAKEYYSFPRYMIISDLSLTACQQFIPILFSVLYNTTIVGFFSMANRMIRLPNIVITTSVGNVFRNEAILEIREKGNCEHLYKSTIKKLIFISFPLYILIFIISPQLFTFVFGKAWEPAGNFARILSTMLLVEFIATPLNTLFYVVGKQKILMRLQVMNSVLIFISIYSGYYFFNNYYISVVLFSGVSILTNIVFLMFTNKLSKGGI